jgi:hypothetical protein
MGRWARSARAKHRHGCLSTRARDARARGVIGAQGGVATHGTRLMQLHATSLGGSTAFRELNVSLMFHHGRLPGCAKGRYRSRHCDRIGLCDDRVA